MGYFTNIENLTLQGNSTIFAYGNELDNVIVGNDGDNYIDGGEGDDTLTGGAGSDTFVLQHFNGASFDLITDFVSGVDRFNLAADNFNLNYGYLQSTAFVSGAGVTGGDGSAQIIYDTNTGDLYYEDGLNADAAIHIATLIGVPTLSESDFYYSQGV